MTMQTIESASRTGRTPGVVMPTFATQDARYRRLREEFKRAAAADLRTDQLDIPSALRAIKEAMPRLVPLRAGLEKALPSFDATLIGWLAAYADTLERLDAECSRPPEVLAPALDDYMEAVALRAPLLDAVQLMASLGHLDTRTLAVDGCSRYHRNVGRDLITLCRSLLETPPRLRKRCPFTRAQLRHGVGLGRRIRERVAERDRARARWAVDQAERHRAFKALYFAYEDVRAAVHVVRGHMRDADTFAAALSPTLRDVASASPLGASIRTDVFRPAYDSTAFKRAS